MKRIESGIKRGIVILLAIILMVSLTACNQSAPFETNEQPEVLETQTEVTVSNSQAKSEKPSESQESGDIKIQSRYANAWSR